MACTNSGPAAAITGGTGMAATSCLTFCRLSTQPLAWERKVAASSWPCSNELSEGLSSCSITCPPSCVGPFSAWVYAVSTPDPAAGVGDVPALPPVLPVALSTRMTTSPAATTRTMAAIPHCTPRGIARIGVSPPETATAAGARPRRPPSSPPSPWTRSALAGLERRVDLVDEPEQLVGDGHVGGLLGVAGGLGGTPEEVVEVGHLLQVLGLEVVGPEHPEVMLDQVGALLLDEDAAGAVVGVLVLLVPLHDRLDRLRLDAGLGRVVDAAGQVAVGVGRGRGAEAVGGGKHSGEKTGRGGASR